MARREGPSAEVVHVATEQELQELSELRARVAALEAALAGQQPQPDQQPPQQQQQEQQQQQRFGRRAALRLAGAAAAGGAAALAATAQAAADDGVALENAPTTTADPVRTGYTGASTTVTAFAFHTGSFNSNTSQYPAALGGWTGAAGTTTHGIFGYTAKDGGCGLVGWSSGDSSPGLRSAGVYARGWYGLIAEGEAAGVYTSGAAVGLDVDGGYTGIRLQATQYPAIEMPTLYGAQLRPRPQLRPTAAGHSKNSLDSDWDGNLWWCTTSGDPGVWRKIAGADTAGAYHALTSPARVYDSRADMLPYANGVLAAGQSRTFQLKDRRNAAGTITQTDVVPQGATAVAFNLTITNTVGNNGYLSIDPGNVSVAATSHLNWFGSGQKAANAGVVTVNSARQVTVTCGGTATSTHFIVDVVGYYL